MKSHQVANEQPYSSFANSKEKEMKSFKLNEHQTAVKPSLPSLREQTEEERLQTNQRDDSYIQTIVDGNPKSINRQIQNFNNLKNKQSHIQNVSNARKSNYHDSCSMIQDEQRFFKDQDEVSLNGSDCQSSQRHQIIQGMSSAHLSKMTTQEVKLNYSNQNLTDITEPLMATNFNMLSHLDLSQNILSQISDIMIKSLPNIRVLILSQNRIKSINPLIKKLSKLQVLRLNSNSILKIPNEIGDIFQLEELDISDNQIFCLPDSIANLSNLRILNASMNQIRSLPPELDQLQSLEQFYIEQNMFSSFPCSYGRLKSLNLFSLDWNKYIFIEPNLPILVSAESEQGQTYFKMFQKLCSFLIQNDKFECDFIDYFRFFNKLNELNLNQIDSRQRTILHNACSNGDLGVVRSLIMSGIDLNILDKDECSALCNALWNHKSEAAKILIEAGADVNLGGGVYGSALHIAVVRNDHLLSDMMIKRGAEVNVADADGNTPLHFIMNVFSKSETKYKAIAESLVLSGARPNSRNKDLWSPLHIAAKKGQIEAIRWAKSTNEILRELQMETFDFNMPGGQQRWTPLHLAGFSGHYKVVEEILSGSLDSLRKFPINVYARNIDFKTPRQCTKGNLVLTKIFRKAEKRYLKEIFELENTSEKLIITNHHLPIKQKLKQKALTTKEQKFKMSPIDDSGYISFLDQLQAIRRLLKHKQKLQKRQVPEFKKLGNKQIQEKSIRLEQSRIIDIPETDEEEEETENQNFNKSYSRHILNDLRKHVIKGDQDKNSIFVDLMKTMSPRTLGQKLSFYQGKNAVVAGMDLTKFQKQLNDSIIQNEAKMKNKQLLFSPRNGRHINIFYLKDKVIENPVIHEKLEALTILHKEKTHQNFDQMLKQMVDKLPTVVLNLQFRSVVDEQIKMIANRGSIECIDLALKCLQQILENYEPLDESIVDDIEEYIQTLLSQKMMLTKISQRVKTSTHESQSNISTQRQANFSNSKGFIANAAFSNSKIINLQQTQTIFQMNQQNQGKDVSSYALNSQVTTVLNKTKDQAIIDFNQTSRTQKTIDNGMAHFREGPGQGIKATTNLSSKNIVISKKTGYLQGHHQSGGQIQQRINETPKIMQHRSKYFGENLQ